MQHFPIFLPQLSFKIPAVQFVVPFAVQLVGVPVHSRAVCVPRVEQAAGRVVPAMRLDCPCQLGVSVSLFKAVATKSKVSDQLYPFFSQVDPGSAQYEQSIETCVQLVQLPPELALHLYCVQVCGMAFQHL